MKKLKIMKEVTEQELFECFFGSDKGLNEEGLKIRALSMYRQTALTKKQVEEKLNDVLCLKSYKKKKKYLNIFLNILEKSSYRKDEKIIQERYKMIQDITTELRDSIIKKNRENSWSYSNLGVAIISAIIGVMVLLVSYLFNNSL